MVIKQNKNKHLSVQCMKLIDSNMKQGEFKTLLEGHILN
jgi:hypothetical protein